MHRFKQLSWWFVATVVSSMFLMLGCAAILRPTVPPSDERMKLENILPKQFGHWQEVTDARSQISLTPFEDRAAATAATYDQTFMRTYENSTGHRVMVAIAYGANQRAESKIHRPELCYAAQGFKVSDVGLNTLLSEKDGIQAIPVKRLMARHDARNEAVSYWIRIGSDFPSGPVASRLSILKEGLSGTTPDGLLFRVSQILGGQARDDETQSAFQIQEGFMIEFSRATAWPQRSILVGKV